VTGRDAWDTLRGVIESVLDSARRRRVAVYTGRRVHAACGGCGRLFGFDPGTVPIMWRDPVTGADPAEGGGPAAWERAVRVPYCPACWAGITGMLAAERAAARRALGSAR